MKRVYVNEKWCLGCHLCEYYCAFAGTNETDMARALRDIKINPKIKIEEKDGVSFAVSCRHCREPLCVKGCITGAWVSHITVLDLAPRILSSILDEDGARLVQNHLESKGIEFRLSHSVGCFEKDTAVLENGERLSFDLLILAVGVRPNTVLLKGIADIDKGIIINEKSETTAADIYAAGDCTQTLDASSGQSRIMALLPNAYMQGECAGINMAGGEKVFDKAIPMNAIGFLGLHMITAGSYDGNVYAENENGNYKRLFYSDNKLNGYILIGNVIKAGIYTSLIRERTPLDALDFALICEKPGLMAFAKEDRMIKLGGDAG